MEFDPQVYLNLFLFCLIPIGGSLLFYFLNRFTKFGKIKSWQKQLIIGVVFGGFAIISTEFGVSISGGAATANVRDAAPLCAGLIFGGPAGAIAGIIGGVERFFATYWGRGDYSQIACTVSTILAGFYAWGLRKFMFDNKRPSWGFALVIGIIMEIVHLTILFFTHIDNSAKAFEIVRLITIPMVAANSFALFASCLIINLIDRKHSSLLVNYKKLTNKIQIWMLVSVLVAFFAATTFVFYVQTNNSYTSATALLVKGIDDVSADVREQSDYALSYITSSVLKSHESQPDHDLGDLCRVFGVSEISVFQRVEDPSRPSGYATTIIKSSNPNYKGWTIGDGDEYKQVKEFEILLFKDPKQKTERGARTLVQEYMAPSKPNPLTPKMKYAGIAFTDDGVPVDQRKDGFIQVGYDANLFQAKINESVKDISKYRHIGENGLVIIADEKQNVVSATALDKQSLKQIGIDITGKQPGVRYDANITNLDGKKVASFFVYAQKEGYTILTSMSTSEVFYSRDNITLLYCFIQVIVFAILFAVIYFLIKKLVVDNISKINNDLAKIIDGNLDVVLKAKGSNEFVSLSDDINTTVSTLKHYINEAASRIDKELSFAKSIQLSALPNVFPAFPNIKEFDIYASMYAAKEVGGDFYDFYFIDSKHIAFIISDVSGKGIPASLFMMESKTMIKNYAMTGERIDKVMAKANAGLCANNGAGMLVTSWLGVMNIDNGQISFVNAGHNPPIVYSKKERKWHVLKQKSNFVLGGIATTKYDLQHLKLNKGDRLFLYTDGIVEATNVKKELYGDERLLNCLNKNASLDINKLVACIKNDIDQFAGEEPQFDDITMLIVELKGKKK